MLLADRVKKSNNCYQTRDDVEKLMDVSQKLESYELHLKQLLHVLESKNMLKLGVRNEEARRQLCTQMKLHPADVLVILVHSHYQNEFYEFFSMAQKFGT